LDAFRLASSKSLLDFIHVCELDVAAVGCAFLFGAVALVLVEGLGNRHLFYHFHLVFFLKGLKLIIVVRLFVFFSFFLWAFRL